MAYAIGTLTRRFTDPVRMMVVEGQTVPRAFDTVIRYPKAPGPFPLIVFGHGYDVTPTPYADLLDQWTRAGYVVAAPIFPLENGNAPGGANENDLPNQPADVSLVITSLQRLAKAGRSPIAHKIDFTKIAVSGQSDGGDTALAAAYGPARDRRITAAMILSGAEDPFAPPFAMPASGPPLLAIQGTADTINPPEQTYQFFGEAGKPKYLLKLIGAEHLPPYSEPGPQLTAVEHMTIAFMDRYLKGERAVLHRYTAARSVGSGTRLTAVP